MVMRTFAELAISSLDQIINDLQPENCAAFFLAD